MEFVRFPVNKIVLERPKTLVLKPTKWVNNGYSLDFYENYACFILGAIPGETVLCQVLKMKSKNIYLRVIEVMEASQDRISSDCEIYLRCGGCSFRHIDYKNELELKRNLLEYELEHKLGFKISEIKLISSNPLHYRNNVQVKIENGRAGFFEQFTNQLVAFPDNGCNNLAMELNKYIYNYKYNKKEYSFRFNEKEVINYNENSGSYELKGKKILIPEHGFFQINRFLLKEWTQEIIDLIPDKSEVVELFSGSGLLSIFISEKARNLISYEIENRSVEFANLNFNQSKIQNSKSYSKNLYKEKITISNNQILVANPPRSGLGEKVIESILDSGPEKIIYSSCNYTTLSLNLKSILKNKNFNYKISKVSILDFFPRTPYFETVVLLERQATTQL